MSLSLDPTLTVSRRPVSWDDESDQRATQDHEEIRPVLNRSMARFRDYEEYR
jgi:hypothetical protein